MKRDKYLAFRARVLENGGFTVFQATRTMADAHAYTRLCRDPDVIIANTQFPNTLAYPNTPDGRAELDKRLAEHAAIMAQIEREGKVSRALAARQKAKAE